MTAKNFIDRTGQRVGHWQVISIHATGRGPTTWLCRCDLCGVEKVWRWDAVYLQKAKARHICECRLAVKELAKSVKMSLAAEKMADVGRPVVNSVAIVADLRDQYGKFTPTNYRKRPTRSDAERGVIEAVAYARSFECRVGMFGR